MSRQKPAFPCFPGCEEPAFAGSGQNQLFPARRGPYYLRYCRTLPKRPEGPLRALFLTSKEGS